MTIRAFISYSHKDADLLKQLHAHLSTLQREKLLDAWTDREIHPGGVIEDQVDQQIEQAELYLLLVSSDFIQSKYCFETEFARACERQQAGAARIVPIIIRECDWNIPELHRFKALPEDGKPVISRHWHSPDEAFANVAAGLRALIETWPSSKPKHPRAQQTVIDDLKKQYRSLEIEGIPCDMPKPGKYTCQIRVHNNTPNTPADNVQVELLEMEVSPETKEYYHPSIPRTLSPAIKGNNTINSGTALIFNLFYARKSEGTSGCHIWAYFVDDPMVMAKNIAGFEGKKNYRLKIRATARDFHKAEEVYNMNFIGEGLQCRFTLTPAQKI